MKNRMYNNIVSTIARSDIQSLGAVHCHHGLTVPLLVGSSCRRRRHRLEHRLLYLRAALPLILWRSHLNHRFLITKSSLYPHILMEGPVITGVADEIVPVHHLLKHIQLLINIKQAIALVLLKFSLLLTPDFFGQQKWIYLHWWAIAARVISFVGRISSSPCLARLLPLGIDRVALADHFQMVESSLQLLGLVAFFLRVASGGRYVRVQFGYDAVHLAAIGRIVNLFDDVLVQLVRHAV